MAKRIAAGSNWWPCREPGHLPSEAASPQEPRGQPSWLLTYDAWEGLKGVPVYSADAVLLGTVIHVYHPLRYRVGARNHHYLQVRRHRWLLPFSHHVLYVPETALKRWSPQRINLGLSSGQIRSSGWARIPPDLARFHRG